MPHGHQIKNQNALHFVTLTTVGWIDVFTYKRYKDLIVDNLNFCILNKGLELYGWVLMSNHLHMICRAKEPFKLSDILRDLKSFSAKQIIAEIQKNTESRREWLIMVMKYHTKFNKRNDNFQFWQHDNHPVELESPSWIKQRLQYLHNNPVRAGITLNPEDYLHSSARNYAGMEGLIPVQILDLGPDVVFIPS